MTQVSLLGYASAGAFLNRGEVVSTRGRKPENIDRRLEPITRRWGWHTLKRADVFDGLQIDMQRVYKTSRRSLFTIVVARNCKPATDAVSGAS